MKVLKKILKFMIVIAILLAHNLSVKGIGFDAEKACEAVFVVYSENCMGSGFSVGKNCIITNAHIIKDIEQTYVLTYGGKKYKTSVFAINKQLDIAVLSVKDANFPYLQSADMSKVKMGDDVYTIGSPKGMTYTLTKGGISNQNRIIENQSYIQIDAPINEGNSGGPLLNNEGLLLGMNTLKIKNSEGIGLAIPINTICSYLKKIGLNLDENGNVIGDIEVNGETTPFEPIPDNETSENQISENSKKNNYLIIMLVLSLTINIFLIILLIRKKNKTNRIYYDSSERTDFDIDIWE